MPIRLACLILSLLGLSGSTVGQFRSIVGSEDWRKSCPCSENLTESQMCTSVKHIEMAPSQGNHVNIHGDAVIDLVVGKNGIVQCAKAVSGHPIALAQLIGRVQKWRFKPLVMDNIARSFCGRLSVKFNIVDNRSTLEVVGPANDKQHP
jgi:hypothetical protein